jgi:hypothetical protein
MVFEKAGTKGRTSLILKSREVQKHRNQRLLKIKSNSQPTLVKAYKEIIKLGGSLFWEPRALRNQTNLNWRS